MAPAVTHTMHMQIPPVQPACMYLCELLWQVLRFRDTPLCSALSRLIEPIDRVHNALVRVCHVIVVQLLPCCETVSERWIEQSMRDTPLNP